MLTVRTFVRHNVYMSTAHRHKKPACKDWHKADIKAALEKAGWTLRTLSETHGYAPGSLVEALRRPWPRAERIIAQAIGRTPQEIWPSRYSRHHITAATSRNEPARGAA